MGKKDIITVLAISIVLGIIILVMLYANRQEEVVVQPQESPREEILRSLSEPSSSPRLTDEEKKEILDSLSAPAQGGGNALSEEEKQEILNSLSAPSS